MFTGLIESVGRIESMQMDGIEATLVIEAPDICGDLAVGDSVAVSGPCLTAVKVTPQGFHTVASAETLQRTTLGKLQPGDRVNLERALRASDRLGGHFVSGHIDGTATLRRIEAEGDSRRLTISIPPSLDSYFVEKGSVALDGISLTVASVGEDTFDVVIIPHTLQHTTLGEAIPGTTLNLEADMLAKYVERILMTRKGEVER